MVGKSLSHYNILEELGRGGMGIVYKAEDTKLDRTVAIKVLPPHALTNEDDRLRFYREARAAAQLNHANICHVYEIDEAVPDNEEGDARPFIAMEFIEGGTLQDRIQERPLKLFDTIRIATQVAEALKVAHSKGIVHRDVKSSNVMLDEDDNAKVLDFGLAKTAQSTLLTKMGSTLGTIAFMSPEQAKGEEVDLRTDLWALGVMIYEMVAGRPPFGGDYEQAVVYSILNEEPEPLTAMRTGVPMDLEWVVRKCMAKSADSRYQSAADLVVDLSMVKLDGSGRTQTIVSSPTVAAGNAPAIHTTPPRRVSIPAVLVVAATSAVITFAASWSFLGTIYSSTSDDYPVVQSEIRPNNDRVPRALSISPDGTLLAYAETNSGVVYIRDLATGEEWQIPDAEGIIELEFSLDGEWLLLDQQNAVLRAPVRGGSPVVLTTVNRNAPHSSWAPDNAVLFDDMSSIYRLSLEDGSITEIASADSSIGEIRLLWARATPDGSLVFARIIREPEGAALAIFSYPDGERLAVDTWNAIGATYLETGHLLVLENGDLMARPFDLRLVRMAGPPVRIARSVAESSWSLSEHGQLVYAPITSFQFTSTAVNAPPMILHRVQPDTDAEDLDFPVQRYTNIRISPDGSKIATEILDSGGTSGDVWILFPEDGFSEQLTFDDSGNEPTWTPDGDSLLVVRRVVDTSELEVLAADGSGMRRTVYKDSLRLMYPDWSGDANLIAVSRVSSQTNLDIWFVNPESGTAFPAVVETGAQTRARFSPNGKYFVFVSDQTIFVRTTSLDGGEWNVSQGPGRDPHWAPDGRSIYFVRSGSLIRVPVEVEGTFRRLGNPEVVFESSDDQLIFAPFLNSDELLIGARESDGTASDKVVITLISNAFSEIKRLAPTGSR